MGYRTTRKQLKAKPAAPRVKIAADYASKRVFSGTRPARKRAAKPAQQSERTLHMHCQQWLEKSGWWTKLLIFHVPNERRGSIGTIMHFKRLGVRPGVADYLIFGLSRDAAIELKDEDGVQDAAQEVFERQWKACGKAYFVIRTLEDFQATVNALGMFG